MSDLDWRIWLFEHLRDGPQISEIVSESSIYGAGSIEGIPEVKPFLVIHLGDEFQEFPGVSTTIATVWAHDGVGNYLVLDDILKRVRNTLCGNGNTTGSVNFPGGIVARWMGDSPDQSDPIYGTLMRNSTYRLVGKDGNA